MSKKRNPLIYCCIKTRLKSSMKGTKLCRNFFHKCFVRFFLRKIKHQEKCKNQYQTQKNKQCNLPSFHIFSYQKYYLKLSTTFLNNKETKEQYETDAVNYHTSPHNTWCNSTPGRY